MTNVDTFTPAPSLIVGVGDQESRRVTLAPGQNLKRGALLGKISASSDFKLAAAAATDGSSDPTAILAEDADATDGAVDALIYTAGTFDENGLIYGAGHSAASVRDALRARGIKLQSSM